MMPEAAEAGSPVAFGISVRMVEFRIVPKTARPMEPPNDRKNMSMEVVTPMSWNSTAFCPAIDVVEKMDAVPNPMRTMGTMRVE